MPKAKLSNVSLLQLLAEVNKRKSKLSAMIAQRDALNAQIAEIESAAGAPAEPEKKAGRKPGRKPGKKTKAVSAPKVKAAGGRRGKPLAAFVQEALAAAPKGLAVRDIENVVLAAGYVTKGKDLYNPIAAVMSKIGAKKVARGVYALGDKAAAPVAKEKKAGKVAAKAKTASAPKVAPAPKAKATSGRRVKPLAVFVQEALVKSKGMGVKDIEKAVLAAGYATKAKTIYNQVVTVLAQAAFKKVSRGVYALKK